MTSVKKQADNTHGFNNMTVGQWILRIIQGSLIGAGSILPGISGGVLCVLFGIYQPMMALLAHPVATFKKYYKLFIPVIIGFLLGFFGLAKLVDMIFKASASIATCLFVGLILGMLPSLFREAGKQGRSKGSWVSFAISFILLFSLLYVLKNKTGINITPNIYWYFFCGVVWGLSLVVPGLSSSSILIFMGLYYPMTEGISNFDLNTIIPLVLGITLTALASARFVNRMIERHYSIVYHVILGVVIASTVLIVPLEYSGSTELIIAIICGIAGCIAALLLDVWGEKVKSKHGIES